MRLSARNGVGLLHEGASVSVREPQAQAAACDDQGVGTHLQEIIDALPFYVMLVDSGHKIQFANKAVRARFGVTPEQIRGKHCPAFIHGVEHYPGCPVDEAIAGGPTEMTHYAEDIGRWLWTTAYPTGVKTKDGLELYFHMVKDVTEDVQAREDLAVSEQKFRSLFEALEDVVFAMSPDGLLREINHSGLELLQIPSKEEALQFNLLENLVRVDTGWDAFLDVLHVSGRVVGHEVSFERPDGQVKTVSINARIVADESEDSGMVRGIMRDITRNRELEKLSITDNLTTLFNRGFFMTRLAAQVRRIRSGESAELSVLFLDIDDFKAYNDAFGHQEGDYVLRRVAEGIRLALRDWDIAARYGGEEFVVILACGAATAHEIAERVRYNVQALCSPCGDGQVRRDITVSVGCATLDVDAGGTEQLISVADARMYDAKRLGKNRVC